MLQHKSNPLLYYFPLLFSHQPNKKIYDEFNKYPNHLSLLSYDLIGLIYYLSRKTNLSEVNKLFKSKNTFKGKIGIFEINDNKINHQLNFYKVDKNGLKKIF